MAEYLILPTRVPEQLRRDLLDDAERYALTPPNPRGGGAFAMGTLSGPDSPPAMRFARWLLTQRDSVEALTCFVPNEVSFQRYDHVGRGLPPHRDQRYYVNAIAILTLRGRARFAILGSADPRDVVLEWDVEPGQVIVLTGWRPSTGIDLRPYHLVDAPVTADRWMVQLRQNVLDDTEEPPPDLTASELDQGRFLAGLPESARR